MAESFSNNKRIAKNTVFLYLRMLITMVVQFYTARVVLSTLGIEDYGIYNVVGGVIVLFAFLNNAMSSASQRFLSYEIGRGDEGDLSRTFSICVYCHAIIAFLLIVLSETIGLWLLKEKLVIPEPRQLAAMWVYHITVVNTAINIMRVPFNAAIISYERMSFYAYVSILEVVLKLAVVYVLVLSPIDKLISYAILLLIVSVILYVIHGLYCKKHFTACRVTHSFSLTDSKMMLSYSGWTMLSGATTVVNQQGGNMLLNVFFGVTFNAAYGIANQVSNAVYMFVSNFQMAFQPQIVKQYASKETDSLISLIIRSSSLSYYLLLIISVPFILHVEWIMNFWLGNPPENASIFCILLLAYFLIDSIQAPLWMVIGASGSIKEYTLWSSGIAILNLPIAYIILKLGGSVLWVFTIRIILNFIIACIRVPYIKKFVDFSVSRYLKTVILPAVLTTLISIVVCYLLRCVINNSLVSIFITLIMTGVIIIFVGLKEEDRKFIYSLIQSRIKTGI